MKLTLKKAKIADIDGVYCGKNCEQRATSYPTNWCNYFKRPLSVNNDRLLRCEKCLAKAEDL